MASLFKYLQTKFFSKPKEMDPLLQGAMAIHTGKIHDLRNALSKIKLMQPQSKTGIHRAIQWSRWAMIHNDPVFLEAIFNNLGPDNIARLNQAMILKTAKGVVVPGLSILMFAGSQNRHECIPLYLQSIPASDRLPLVLMMSIETVRRPRETVLHAAVRDNQQQVAKTILENLTEADRKKALSALDGNGKSVWELAIDLQMVEILSTLAMGSAQHSASIVDQVLADGKTALHRASERNHYQVADALLELSANYHTVDADGNTALGIARVRDGLNPQPLTISRLLQNKGAYVFSQKLKVVPQPTSSEPTPSPRNLP